MYLGFGVIRVNDMKAEYLDMGIIDLHKEKDPYSKLLRIFNEVGAVLDRYHPDDMALESPFLGKNAQVIFKLGRAQGAAILSARSRGMEVFEYAPRKAKSAITGNGNASKEQVDRMVQNILGIKIDAERLDATDALAIAMCHYYQLSGPVVDAKAASSWEKFLEAHPDRIVK